MFKPKWGKFQFHQNKQQNVKNIKNTLKEAVQIPVKEKTSLMSFNKGKTMLWPGQVIYLLTCDLLQLQSITLVSKVTKYNHNY